MKATPGLAAKTLTQINLVLARFPEVEQVLLFGSRIKGTHRLGSDIDLALIGRDLNWRIVGRIYDALDDLLLPYKFSLIEYDVSTDPAVAAPIGRVGFALYERAEVSPPGTSRHLALRAGG